MEEISNGLSENEIMLFLVQFFLLLGLSRSLSLLFKRFRQPVVTADVLIGVILGPSILGRFWPDLHRLIFPEDPSLTIMLDTVAWIGIFFLLLVTGLEVNFSSVWKHRGKALWIALSDIIVPIVFSAIVLYFLPSRYMIDPQKHILFVFFISTIMTISAMPVSIRVMQDLKLLRTDLGFITISALSINDIVGWVVFTIILGIFTHGSADFTFASSLIFFTALFLLFAATVGKNTIGFFLSIIRRKSFEASGPALTVVLLAGLFFGALTQKIGINALFGFFVAGLIAGESNDLPEKTRSTIDQFVNSVFIPIFFANIGLKIDLFKSFDVFLVCLFTVLGVSARFLGAYFGVLFAGIPKAQRLPVSALHTPGGEMHIVIGTLALNLNLINDTVFVAIIVSAILSTITLGPMLSFMIRRIIPKQAVQIPSNAAIEIKAIQKYEVLRILSGKASQIIGKDQQLIYDLVKNREEGMSTGLENGVAIPHARIPEMQIPAVLLGFSTQGVDWDSPDGIPAKLIFFILTPLDRNDTQLEIYRQLTNVLSKKENLNAIISAPSLQALVTILNENLRVSAIAG